MRWRSRVTTAVLVVLAGPALTAPAAFPGATGPGSGGDPYVPLAGNAGYQVEHYRIVDTYRPGNDRLTGRTVLRAVATSELSLFHLDLALRADDVTVDGRRAAFSRPDRHELRVVPAAPIPAGQSFRVRVRYHGRPGSTTAAGARPFTHVPGEGVASGQPRMGPWWFAANETPADKATYRIELRVPRGQEAISNGELVSRRTQGRWTRWTWRMREPMATYLAFFAAGQFRLERTTADGRPAVYAVSRMLSRPARRASLALMRTTPEVVSWLESELGEYPFTSIGGVVAGGPVPYLLETQSRPVYPFIGGLTRANVSLVVHEQAHQWFGDDVSVQQWRDIWLNEGLATYAEWAWEEHRGGRSVAERLQQAYDARPGGDAFWDLRISDPGPQRMFSDVVYQRGAMTVAALRNRVGDADLSALLRAWVAQNRHGHGSDPAFRALAESVTGEDLDDFFTHWLDETSRPAATEGNGLR